MMRSFIFSSNSIRLFLKDWIAVIVILAGIIWFAPRFWIALEEFNPPPDYRMPYELSNDYWMFTRWSKRASSKYPVLIIGDSVIWGQYVKREDTLSQCLNNCNILGFEVYSRAPAIQNERSNLPLNRMVFLKNIVGLHLLTLGSKQIAGSFDLLL